MSVVPTTHPTDFIPWAVGPTVVEFLDDASALMGVFETTNEIGLFSSDIDLGLFTYDCVDEVSMTGHEVELYQDEFETNPFTYNVSLDNFMSDSYTSAGLVTFTEEDSIGEFRFCTRVATLLDTVTVAFRETNFVIGFQITDSESTINGIEYQERNIDHIDTTIDADGVEACQCQDDYSCFTPGTGPDVVPGATLNLCMFPAIESTFISNFELDITSPDEEVQYRPVAFGASGWEPNFISRVDVQGDDIKVSTVLIADFYTNGYEFIHITGNVMLEFVGRVDSRFADFDMLINLDLGADNIEGDAGCLKAILNRISGLFR